MENMKILSYTFRTFPFLNNLRDTFPEVFIFGKLKIDIENFCDHIIKTRPDMIIGIAYSKSGSFFEKFSKNRTIITI